MPPAVRVSDKASIPADAHGCPACPHPGFGPAVNGSPDVMINKLPAVRLGDPGVHMACCGANQWKVAKGSSTVYVNNKPLARMGDKTTHCGGSGSLINGSPNVFADDGASGASKLKELKAKILQIRDELRDKWDGKKKDKKGKWDAKDGKDGKNKKTKKKGDGPGGQDVSSDAKKDADAAGKISACRMEVKASAPNQKIPFVVEAGAACQGEITVEVYEKGGEEVLTTTTVQAKLEAKGSFKAPKLPEGQDTLELVIKAKHGETVVESADSCTVAEQGMVLRLYDEKHGPGDEMPDDPKPNNRRPKTTVLVTESVSATVYVTGENGEKTYTVNFEKGVAHLVGTEEKPVEKPSTTPADGEAYGAESIKVVFDDPKFKDYTVEVFAPPTKHKSG